MYLIMTPSAFKQIVWHGELAHLMENMKANDHKVYVYSEVYEDYVSSFESMPHSEDILKYYYDLHFIPQRTNTTDDIRCFVNTYCPDNVLIVVYSLAEFNYLNRLFSNDELIPYTDPRIYDWPIDKILLDVNNRFGG